MNKSIRKPIKSKDTPIKVNRKGGKKDNIVYLKQRYSYHYRKGQWNKAEEYNQYTLTNYNVNLRDWMEGKEASKMKNKNAFGFDNRKKIKYG